MPETLPGFLMVAGLTSFVVGLFRGPVEFGPVKLPDQSDRSRMTLRVLGIVSMGASAVLYFFDILPWLLMASDNHPMAPP